MEATAPVISSCESIPASNTQSRKRKLKEKRNLFIINYITPAFFTPAASCVIRAYTSAGVIHKLTEKNLCAKIKFF